MYVGSTGVAAEGFRVMLYIGSSLLGTYRARFIDSDLMNSVRVR